MSAAYALNQDLATGENPARLSTVASSFDQGSVRRDPLADARVAQAPLQVVLACYQDQTSDPEPSLAWDEEADTADVMLPMQDDAGGLETMERPVGSGRSLRQPRASTRDAAVVASAQKVGAAFSTIFEAARCGNPVSAQSLEQGGNLVVAAVGGKRIGAWLEVVRDYDDVTYQHCLLVAGLAASFATQIGVTVKRQRLVAQAALVHDIGKAGISQAILNKAGPLSASEMAVMRTHAALGHDMLVRQGGFDPELLDIVRHHHEYLDGSGYPDALSGARISTLVRLATISDIYGALVERRSYKAPKSPWEAMSIMVDMGGKLDQELLKSFAGMVAATR